MTNPALNLFNDRLPRKPYFSDDLHFGVRIAGKERSILAKYIQFNLPHAISWLGFDVDRVGAAAFASRSEFKNVAYGASVVNAVFQHFDINEMICDLNVRRFARANQTGNMMGINPCDAAVWDGESRCLRIGTVVTYNWATMEVEALCFNGEGLEVRNLMQRFSFLPKNVLDAGYVLSSTQNTIVPVNFMCLDMMTDLFSKSCNILTSASHDASKRDTDEEGN